MATPSANAIMEMDTIRLFSVFSVHRCKFNVADVFVTAEWVAYITFTLQVAVHTWGGTFIPLFLANTAFVVGFAVDFYCFFCSHDIIALRGSCNGCGVVVLFDADFTAFVIHLIQEFGVFNLICEGVKSVGNPIILTCDNDFYCHKVYIFNVFRIL